MQVARFSWTLPTTTRTNNTRTIEEDRTTATVVPSSAEVIGDPSTRKDLVISTDQNFVEANTAMPIEVTTTTTNSEGAAIAIASTIITTAKARSNKNPVDLRHSVQA